MAHPAFLYFGYLGPLSRVERPGRGVYHTPNPAPRLRMSGIIPPLPHFACLACYGKTVFYAEEFADGKSA